MCVIWFEVVGDSPSFSLSHLMVLVYMSLVGEVDQLVDALSILKERAENDDPNALFSLCNDLSKVGTLSIT